MSEERKTLKYVDQYCAICGRQLNTWELRICKATGHVNPICESCLAEEYDLSVDEVREIAEHHFGLVPCLGL